MPQIGEIQKGRDIGKADKTGNFIWQACADCGKERWVLLHYGKPRNTLCLSCKQKGHEVTAETRRKLSFSHRGQKAYRWKGGRSKTKQGYIVVWLSPDDFFYPMAQAGGYVFEHRLVVAKALGRCLHRWEVVHHKGVKYPKGSIENKQDNRYPENLQLNSDVRHNQITILENHIIKLENENQKLRGELNAGNKFGGNPI